MQNRILFGIIVFVSFIFIGCLKDNAEKNLVSKTQQKKSKPSIVVIMGNDDTGSYKIWEKAKQTASEIVIQLNPGDVFYLRRITDKSYTDECSILRLELPKIESGNVENPFDRKDKKKRKLDAYRHNALKRETITRILKIQPSGAPYTDINGFLAVASEKFDLFYRNKKRILCIASDLKENVKYKPDIDLTGVCVAVVAFQPMKDPKKTQNFKESWTKTFKKYGAEKVVFYRTDEKINLKDL